jgi:phage terminase small subunit
MKKLTHKERKFVKQKIAGASDAEAYNSAYSPQNNNVARVAAHKVKNRPHVQQAIEAALEAQGLTAEWAVAQLGKVAAQDDELGAKRLASKDILELHGWNKNERPTVQIQMKNAFFQTGRQLDDIREAETVE